MATIAFELLGSTLGQSLGGTFGAAFGKTAGALAGGLIDRAFLGQGARRVQQGPRLTDLDGISASEGAPIPRIYGRVRLGGQVIWATEFEEQQVVEKSGGVGGKSAIGARQKSIRYVYSANVAIGLCEGPVAFVRRIWADGKAVDLSAITYRIYRGEANQPADPLIVAKQGTGQVPAFRGLAYIVFERFPLADYGNRLPQFSFEIVRPMPGLPDRLKAVNIFPGSTEFGYATEEVREDFGYGTSRTLNRSQWTRGTDWEQSIDDLQALCPNLERATLICAWFGDDLRVGNCTITPRVEKKGKITTGQSWQVCGLTRETAQAVSASEGRPNYGGTPSDLSIIQAIRDLKARGLKVALHPFILMDIPPGNGRPDPYSNAADQPAFPWRGRMTCNPAPEKPGSPAGTTGVNAGIANFIGSAQASHFVLSGDTVLYAGPAEWSFRRMVLHHAMLAKAAGGVDTFFIASELVGLTHLSAGGGSYPMVAALTGLLGELRGILGPSTCITYAADWTEYGAHVRGGGQEVRFPLDPFWSHPEVAAVAIDFYPPVTDWREEPAHFDASLAETPHDPAYLVDRIGAGEGFDWFYADAGSRANQIRTPISDGAYGKPWIYRPKDLVGWWSNTHRERVGGVEIASNTGWQPRSKPILLAEIGCGAVDKGTNQPNIFPDPKSVENGLPYFSRGHRDDMIQRRLLEAMLDRFDPASTGHIAAHNPVSPVYGGPMVMPDFIAPWAYDARPFPAFPAMRDQWADGQNFARGHWLNGRLEIAPLPELIATVIADHAADQGSVQPIGEAIEGFVVDRPMTARAVLEPLLDSFGLLASGDGAELSVKPRAAFPVALIARDDLVAPTGRNGAEIEIARLEERDLPRSFRLGFVDPDRDFRKTMVEARRDGSAAQREVSEDVAMILPKGRARRLAEQRLAEAWAAREVFRFALPPSARAIEAGDLVAIETEAGIRLVRLTRISDQRERVCEAVSHDPETMGFAPIDDDVTELPVTPALPGAPYARLLELPILRSESASPLHLAMRAEPWRGPYALTRTDQGGTVLGEAVAAARFGTLMTALAPGPLWRWDHASSCEILLVSGALASVDEAAVLAGNNALALMGPDGEIEIVLFRQATLVADRRYRLSGLLRGVGLSERAALRILAPGAQAIVLDDAVVDLGLGVEHVGQRVELAIIPAGRDIGDPAVARTVQAIAGKTYRPLSPVHARARREAGGIRLTFIRRARFGGDNWELYEVPLAEEREEYRIEIRDGATVKRSVTVATPEYLYGTAEETADFGAPRGSLDVTIVQLSTRIGAGDPLVTTLRVQ
ncbi:MAG: glycoside hydrolase/phage tail family protein [Methylobacterium sp.]|nr:glycoside hydrolase/phage tail family protein [Methylobacterium sp.]MCA3657469.1 glycoside hydrolase/phage tail family protein [Methylobacterium sp.]MCA3661376.1 glycoside hydrolase/phage tail family protein [Methylobacterium sp.]MCA3662699.1 glycoside hydrolase/phage tail family protein [Methylobacterium sp.]MCA3670842.1 glycoside hydrolase/phage tail family protein [Methylobacterium sp.]